MTCVEAKFGLRNPRFQVGANRELEDTEIQWMLTRSTNFSCILHGKTKRFISPREGYFKCGGNHIQRDCPALATPRNGNGNGKKCKQSKFWFKGAGKGKSKEGERDGQFKGTPWVPRVPNVRTKVRVRKLVCPVWKTHKQSQERPQTYHTDNSDIH